MVKVFAIKDVNIASIKHAIVVASDRTSALALFLYKYSKQVEEYLQQSDEYFKARSALEVRLIMAMTELEVSDVISISDTQTSQIDDL